MIGFVLLVGFVALAQGQSEKDPVRVCGTNATVVECTSMCPPTCAELNPICDQTCGMPGCQCKPGYVQNSQLECISPKDCPVRTCPDPNAEYYTANGMCASSCIPTCEDRNPTICTQQCRPSGCYCKSGYLLSNGKCVKPEDCPANTCPDPNAEYYTANGICASSCIPTCEDRNPLICTLQCRSSGCYCKSGYLLSNGKCVKPQDCPANTCPDPNAEYYTANGRCASSCIPTCEDRDPTICTHQCRPSGCYCKSGYLMYNGKCVLPQDCPATTTPVCDDPNQTYSQCPSACPATCAKTSSRCIQLCMSPGCQCKPGYVIGPNNKCILKEDCPSQ